MSPVPYWSLTDLPSFLGSDNGVLISFKKQLQKRICHPLSQQKEAMLGTKETSSSLPDGVNSLLSGRRNKWLPLGPTGIPGPMLTPCSFIITITCLKVRGWSATWSCGLSTGAPHYKEQICDREVGTLEKWNSVCALERQNWRLEGSGRRERAKIDMLSSLSRASRMVYNSLELKQM